MFSVLFGLQWVLQSLIDWAFRRDVAVCPDSDREPSIKQLVDSIDGDVAVCPDSDREPSIKQPVDSIDGGYKRSSAPFHTINTSQDRGYGMYGDAPLEEVILPAKVLSVSSAPQSFHFYNKGPNEHKVAQDILLHAGHKHGLELNTNTSSGNDELPAKVQRVSYAAVATESVDGGQEKKFDVTDVHGFWQMPFLSDPETVEFIRHSHTMFIMRGLPGSGKSTVVRCLKETYKGQVVVCSADDYFMDKFGNYNFDASKLSNAHTYCQNKAAFHCEKGTSVVIIDNTNIQRWTMAFYIKLAQTEQYYHVVIVEPLTPWRYDPVELARRNTHCVDEETITWKLKSLRDNVYTPLYYGWFLTHTDSAWLAQKARQTLKQCVEELSWPGLGPQEMQIDISGMEDLLNSLDSSFNVPLPMLHCTAAYLARRSRDPYHTSEIVAQSIGSKFILQISGFVFSKRAISARVDLTSSGFMCSPERTGKVNATNRHIGTRNVSGQYSSENGSHVPYEENIMLQLYWKEEEEILQERYKDVHASNHGSQDRHALFQHSCSAHITISYAVDGQSKQSGEDLLNICELEFYGRVKQRQTSIGKMSVYGPDMAQLKLYQPLSVSCLFHGYYGARGK